MPGDVWVGVVACWFGAGIIQDSGTPVLWATVASVLIYMFGLADNDIVGAQTDRGRPIPDGEISIRAARIARALCLFAAAGLALVKCPIAHARLPIEWWGAALALVASILVYNRTKWWWLMGVCRGLNVLCGGAVAFAAMKGWGDGKTGSCTLALAAVVLVWTGYIAAVTKYSEGEEADAAKKRRVGFLVGAIVYLQIIALLLFQSGVAVLAVALLVVMRLMKRFLPEVSAS